MNAPLKDFHDLNVWRKAHQLTLSVYRITPTFPREELYNLTSQLRRSRSSIPANLAEGAVETATPNLLVIAPSPWDLPANWKPANYEDLSRHTTGLKRMPTGLLQRLQAGRKLKADS